MHLLVDHTKSMPCFRLYLTPSPPCASGWPSRARCDRAKSRGDRRGWASPDRRAVSRTARSSVAGSSAVGGIRSRAFSPSSNSPTASSTRSGRGEQHLAARTGASSGASVPSQKRAPPIGGGRSVRSSVHDPPPLGLAGGDRQFRLALAVDEPRIPFATVVPLEQAAELRQLALPIEPQIIEDQDLFAVEHRLAVAANDQRPAKPALHLHRFVHVGVVPERSGVREPEPIDERRSGGHRLLHHFRAVHRGGMQPGRASEWWSPREDGS